MKRPLAIALAVVASLLLISLPAVAVDQVWDTVSGDGAAITNGSGTWENGNANVNWNSSGTNVEWNNANGDTAVFGQSAALTADYTVTVNGGVSAGGIKLPYGYSGDTTQYGYLLTGGAITLTGAAPEINVAGTADKNNGDINNVIAGASGLTKTGTGDVRLAGQNTYSGVTKIVAGGLRLNCSTGLAIPGDVAFANTSGNARVWLDRSNQINPDAIISFTDAARGYLMLEGQSQTVGGLNCATPVSSSTTRKAFIQNWVAGTSTLTIDVAAGQDYTYYGALRENILITGSKLAVVKDGPGTQRLLGSGTYTGYTDFSGGLTVREGTLVASMSTPTSLNSSIVVEALGTLDVSAWTGFNIPTGKSLSGNGTVVASTLVASAGSSVAPGQSIGQLTISGNATLSGSFDVEYDDNAETIDKLVVSGALDIDGATLNLSDFNGGIEQLDLPYYVFAQYGTLGGTASEFAAINGLPDGYEIDYAYGGNRIALVAAVPEPGMLVLLTAGLPLLALRRRR